MWDGIDEGLEGRSSFFSTTGASGVEVTLRIFALLEWALQVQWL